MLRWHPRAGHPDHRRDRDARPAPLDVLVLREQARGRPRGRLGAPGVELAQARLGGLALLLEGGAARPRRPPRARPAPPPRVSSAFWSSPAAAVSAFDLLALLVVGLLGDVDLAGQRGVLAGGADLAQPPLPLLHLVALHGEQRLELAALALVPLERGASPRRTPGGRRAPAASISARRAGTVSSSPRTSSESRSICCSSSSAFSFSRSDGNPRGAVCSVRRDDGPTRIRTWITSVMSRQL